ncbi:methyltransferase domain-containing protein [Actinomadura darangshiensis]|uniref:Protein-L-isoaspartate O-methyltransferase n=1 Tax=Actinomadura darangshiensis TaxID=705336 RepID=A0A4R5B4Z2_9ACTN|nr:methyltransferase domain-containing protein [Actinomadura darangshiensis]TDD79640.1 methyltransferase domain-containing protein [Actinomadura darangshiensis]
MEDVTQRLDGLVGRLSAAGWLTQERVREALRDVPRHAFVPAVAWTGEGERVDRATASERWLDLVYQDDAIITQLDDGQTDVTTGDGRFTSSCSAPSTVVSLLELLDAEVGHRVLDVGTGTGWTAGLLSRIVGAENVTSVEVDPQVSAQAAENLKAVGLSPRLVVGDGAEGWKDGLPFDRVHATCGVSRVPYEWVRQTRPGGVIVAPYAPGFASGHELRLVVTPDGTAVGTFAGYASYMMMRSHRQLPWPARDGEGTEHTTQIDPRTIGYAPAGADLAMGAFLPGVNARGLHEGDTYVMRLWTADVWASATYRQASSRYEVRTSGGRNLWDEAVDAYFWWVGEGSPGRERYGLTVTPEAEFVWLDSAGKPVSSGAGAGGF